MKAWVCIVLGIGLLIAAVDAQATRWGKATSVRGFALPGDTARAAAPAAAVRQFHRWNRPALQASCLLDGLSHALPMAHKGIPGRSGSAGDGASEPRVDQALYGADGNVLSVALSGNTMYIAGAFRSVGPNFGGCVALDARTAQMTAWFPKIAGSVMAIVPDGAGGWFIGGEFSGVGGKPRACLAQVLPDGSVSDWTPSVTGSPGYVDPPAVYTLAVYSNRVYVGGAFRMINGQECMSFGCVDATTGALIDATGGLSVDAFITALALHRDTLFVGGTFASIGGVARSGLAALNAGTGDMLPWQVDLYGGASTLLDSGDTLYVGGTFTQIAGLNYSKIAAVDIAAATPLPIDFRFGGVWQQYAPLLQVDALSKVGDTLYVGGNFTQLGGQARSSIAAVNAGTGDALAWLPDSVGPRSDGWPPPQCTSLCVVGGSLYAGGYFGTVGGQYHPLLASWDRQTGTVSDWVPAPDDVPGVFALRGDTLLVGGLFNLFGGWQHRAGLAAIDLPTGRLKSWNPNPDGRTCTAVAVHHGRVIVSGDFSIIGGDPQPRSYLAALDTLNGEVVDWNPGANDLATTFLLAGDTLYVGGMFSTIGGQPRNGLAAVDATTGTVLPWDPNAGYYFDGLSLVYAMARSGDTIFLGGTFTEMGGQARQGLAGVDASTGALSTWNPGTDNSAVNALLVADGRVYVGGGFRTLGGQPRNAIGAVDASSAVVLPWYPPPTAWGVPSEVEALAILDGLIYVGGAFATLNGQPRICLGAVDTATSIVTGWDPGLDGYVWSLAASGRTMYVGGGFSRAGGIPADGLAAFTLDSAAPTPPRKLELAQCFPNPAAASAQIRIGLPQAEQVTLSVYDIQGRRVAVPLNHVQLGAGGHVVQLEAKSWRPGVYLCRLESGREQATRKLVVVK